MAKNKRKYLIKNKFNKKLKKINKKTKSNTIKTHFFTKEKPIKFLMGFCINS